MLFASGVLSLYNPIDMTATLEAVRDKPVALYQMDDSSPFQDYSGYNRSGTTVAGTAGTAVSLATGAVYSTVFTPDVIGKFDSSVFKQGSEDNSFSLEAWFLPINKGAVGEQQVLGNSGQYDGLVVNGTEVSFVTKYLTTGECRASYDLQIPRRVHAVGVHTSGKNMLYVDGELVAETEVSEEQKADQFVATDGFLYSGASLSTMQIAINNIGLYTTALPPESVYNHFATGDAHAAKESVPVAFGGVRIPLSKNEADVFLEQTWTTQYDWESAYLTDVVVERARLKPRLDANNISVSGTWLDVFPLGDSEATSIYGVNMLWDGEGAIIEASLDGSTWETAVRGKNLSIIPPGFDPTDKELHIRISFSGGVEFDPSYVDNLTITGFLTGAIPTIENRTVTTTGYVREDYNPREFRDDWGLELPTGETVTISADSSPDPLNPRTVEVWAKGTFTTNLTGAVEIVNGGYFGIAPVPGEWQLRTYTFASGLTGDIVFTSSDDDTVIGQVMLYPDEQTTETAADVYNYYMGIPALQAADSSVIGITEPAEASSIYDYDWSISASG